MVNLDESSIKQSLLTKYETLNVTIKRNGSCYAISADWWLTFKFIYEETRNNPDTLIGHPGPINNLNLVTIEEAYKQEVMGGSQQGAFDDTKLHLLTDWDQMLLRTDMKYQQDFVIVSQPVWGFLHNLFGGGPEVELIPEKNPYGDTWMYDRALFPGGQQPALVTPEDEKALNTDLCVNLEVKRVYYLRDHSETKVHSFCVSLTANAKTVFEVLCRKLMSPLYNTKVSLLNEDNEFVELTDYESKSLTDLGIQENSVLDLSFKHTNEWEAPQPIDGNDTWSREESKRAARRNAAAAAAAAAANSSNNQAYGSDIAIPLPEWPLLIRALILCIHNYILTDLMLLMRKEWTSGQGGGGIAVQGSKAEESQIDLKSKHLLFPISAHLDWKIDYEMVFAVKKQVEQSTQDAQKVHLDYKSLSLIKSNLKQLDSAWFGDMPRSKSQNSAQNKKRAT